MVFPLGMFAVASLDLGRVDALPIVKGIGDVALMVALGVWAIVFAAMMVNVTSVIRASAKNSP